MSYQGLNRPRPVFNTRPPTPVVPFARVGRTETGMVIVPLEGLLARFRLVCEQQPERAGRPTILVMPRPVWSSVEEQDPALLSIAESVAGTFGFTVRDLVSERRTVRMIPARQAMFWLARDLTRHSLPVIGRAYNRNHTTVLNGIARCEERMEADTEYRKAVFGISWRLRRCWSLPQEVQGTLDKYERGAA